GWQELRQNRPPIPPGCPLQATSRRPARIVLGASTAASGAKRLSAPDRACNSTSLFPDRIRTSRRSSVSRLGASCNIATVYHLAGAGNESGLGACKIGHQPRNLFRLA